MRTSQKYRCGLAVLCAVCVLAVGGLLRAEEANKLRIGFAIEAMNGERWQTDLEAFKTRARSLGAEVISADARGDDDRQLQQVQDMIKKGIKALVLLPHDTNKASQIVAAAKAAGVKVVSYDRLVQNSDVDLYVSFDRLEIGGMQAKYLVENAPKGNYVLIGGSPNDEGAKTLHDAQMRVLKPNVERGEIKVIADGYTKDWLPTEAYLAMLKAIDSAQGNITAVLAANDGLAGGAIQALREHNMAGRVLVTGQAILLKPITVTKENIKETVVKDGFQTLKRINEGLPADQQIQ